MNDSEFLRWQRHHTRAFPALAGWLTDKGDATEQAEILTTWRTTLRPVSLDEATAATDAMQGAEHLQCGFGQHPARIVTIANQARRRTQPQQDLTSEAAVARAENKRQEQRLEDEHGATLDAMTFEERSALLPDRWDQYHARRPDSFMVRIELLRRLDQADTNVPF